MKSYLKCNLNGDRKPHGAVSENACAHILNCSHLATIRGAFTVKEYLFSGKSSSERVSKVINLQTISCFLGAKAVHGQAISVFCLTIWLVR